MNHRNMNTDCKTSSDNSDMPMNPSPAQSDSDQKLESHPSTKSRTARKSRTEDSPFEFTATAPSDVIDNPAWANLSETRIHGIFIVTTRPLFIKLYFSISLVIPFMFCSTSCQICSEKLGQK